MPHPHNSPACQRTRSLVPFRILFSQIAVSHSWEDSGPFLCNAVRTDHVATAKKPRIISRGGSFSTRLHPFEEPSSRISPIAVSSSARDLEKLGRLLDRK